MSLQVFKSPSDFLEAPVRHVHSVPNFFKYLLAEKNVVRTISVVFKNMQHLTFPYSHYYTEEGRANDHTYLQSKTISEQYYCQSIQGIDRVSYDYVRQAIFIDVLAVDKIIVYPKKSYNDLFFICAGQNLYPHIPLACINLILSFNSDPENDLLEGISSQFRPRHFHPLGDRCATQ